jgi:hypothetical protein
MGVVDVSAGSRTEIRSLFWASSIALTEEEMLHLAL